ncbi:MAG: KH domain-containing protein [Anaerorhabdus sp.]
MAEFEKILFDLIEPMVDDKKCLEVRQMASLNEQEVVLHVYAKDDDVARLIGKKGSMATALRQMMSIASRADDKRIMIQFEAI